MLLKRLYDTLMTQLGFRRFVVKDNERGLLFSQGRFQRVLNPGQYDVFDFSQQLVLELFDLGAPNFQRRNGEILLKEQPELEKNWLSIHRTAQEQVGLCYQDGSLIDIIPPAGVRIFWRQPRPVEVRLLSIAEDPALPPELLPVLIRGQTLLCGPPPTYCTIEDIPENHIGLLFVNGKFSRELGPGVHAFWKLYHRVQVLKLDLRLLTLEVSGQELLTKDKVTLRVNLTASYKINDPRGLIGALGDYREHFYKELQFGLREAVSAETLDTLLDDKNKLNAAVHEYVKERLGQFGLSVISVGVKDIILPGEMRTILNQVVEAEKLAQANIIRRREETAATRSLHNTAKMLENNPMLLRLKELETLEKVTEKINQLTVVGGLEGVLQGLVQINGAKGGA